jgi:CRP-like cAMP-binding protein
MAENGIGSRSEQDVLRGLERLDSHAAISRDVFAQLGRSQFFTDLSAQDIDALAGYMEVYRAQGGDIVIREDDAGDFLLLIIEGAMDILKKDERGEQRHMTSVGPGMTLGEMSMIDGEPRFATCVATVTTVFAVLNRDRMARILLDHPALGTKILLKLVAMLSLRLRQTSVRLLRCIEGGH